MVCPYGQPMAGPVPGDTVAMPAQQRVRGDEPASPEPTGEGSGDRAEKGPVVVIDGWSVDLAAKHGEVVA